jgi:uncharacterized Zn-binding protein involved in type VI secretion
MVTVLVPHVGGPILPPGVPTVLIDFLPAATVTSMATCVGPPDVIVLGSMGVMIGGLPAARMGDMTAHGGVIVLGSFTCMIGEVGTPSPGAAGAGGISAGLVASGVKVSAPPSVSTYAKALASSPGGASGPVLSDASSDVANSDAFDFYMQKAQTLDVSTKENCAVCYSGPGNRKLAEQFGAANGKTTLEMTPGGKWLDDQKLFRPDSPLTLPQTLKVWGTLSKRFAEGASGSVVGIVTGSNKDSIFNSVEYDALLKNPKVTNVLTGGS